MASTGTIFVVSAPSGAGKSTILSRVLAKDRVLGYSVSATTRQPRNGEIDGTHYRFVDEATFTAWREEGLFTEWAQVHGNYYGTLESDLHVLLEAGRDVVLEIDVEGARQMRRDGRPFVSIFLAPPSLEELERRLHARGDLTDEAMALRLENAKAELAARNEYDHCVVNDKIDEAVAEFEEIVKLTREHRA